MNSLSPSTYIGHCNFINFGIVIILGDKNKGPNGVLITMGKAYIQQYLKCLLPSWFFDYANLDICPKFN